MNTPAFLSRVEHTVTRLTARYGIRIACLSLGIIYLWFGLMKFLPGHSPIDDLVGRTIAKLSFGHIPPRVSLPLLATWECLIGLGFLTGLARRMTLLLFFLQMPGTVLPLFFFPHEIFIRFPYELSLEGQYIVKNLVLVSVGLIIAATLRGGRLTPKSSAAVRAQRFFSISSGRLLARRKRGSVIVLVAPTDENPRIE